MSEHKCENCAALAAERDAAVKEAAALREAADALVERIAQMNLWETEENALRAAMIYGSEAMALRKLLDDPSEAVAALERRLARAEQLEQETRQRWLRAENKHAQALRALSDCHLRAEALAELVPSGHFLYRLAYYAEYVSNTDDTFCHTASQDTEAARALAARIEEAREEQGQEDGGDAS